MFVSLCVVHRTPSLDFSSPCIVTLWVMSGVLRVWKMYSIPAFKSSLIIGNENLEWESADFWGFEFECWGFVHNSTIYAKWETQSAKDFWPCPENWLIRTIPTIPNNLHISFKWGFTYCGLGWNWTSQNHSYGSQLETHILVVRDGWNCLDEPVFLAGPKPMLTEFGIDWIIVCC